MFDGTIKTQGAKITREKETQGCELDNELF
jgi:hypothetical protein